MWDLPGPGLEPVSPALAGGFLTTAPPGEPLIVVLICIFLIASDVEHLVMFFLAIHWRNVYSDPLPILKLSYLSYFFIVVKYT